jgi:large subunit ribosomal protein L17
MVPTPSARKTGLGCCYKIEEPCAIAIGLSKSITPPPIPRTELDWLDSTTTMRHQKTRNKLSRDSAHRKALLMNLTKEVLEHERIKTTEAKAKAVKPEIEKLITLAKRDDLHNRRQALSALAQDKFAVHRLFVEVAPRYVDRPGGYTRILKLGPRRSDSTEMVFLELV